ncbi:MAG: hypothetical protein AAGK02_00860, partial [Pseudomonadota bacterium]
MSTNPFTIQIQHMIGANAIQDQILLDAVDDWTAALGTSFDTHFAGNTIAAFSNLETVTTLQAFDFFGSDTLVPGFARIQHSSIGGQAHSSYNGFVESYVAAIETDATTASDAQKGLAFWHFVSFLDQGHRNGTLPISQAQAEQMLAAQGQSYSQANHVALWNQAFSSYAQTNGDPLGDPNGFFGGEHETNTRAFANGFDQRLLDVGTSFNVQKSAETTIAVLTHQKALTGDPNGQIDAKISELSSALSRLENVLNSFDPNMGSSEFAALQTDMRVALSSVGATEATISDPAIYLNVNLGRISTEVKSTFESSVQDVARANNLLNSSGDLKHNEIRGWAAIQSGDLLAEMSTGISVAGQLAAASAPDVSSLSADIQATLAAFSTELTAATDQLSVLSANPQLSTMTSTLDAMMARLASASSAEDFRAGAESLFNTLQGAETTLVSGFTQIDPAHQVSAFVDASDFQSNIDTATSQFANGDVNGALQTLTDPVKSTALKAAGLNQIGQALAPIGTSSKSYVARLTDMRDKLSSIADSNTLSADQTASLNSLVSKFDTNIADQSTTNRGAVGEFMNAIYGVGKSAGAIATTVAPVIQAGIAVGGVSLGVVGLDGLLSSTALASELTNFVPNVDFSTALNLSSQVVADAQLVTGSTTFDANMTGAVFTGGMAMLAGQAALGNVPGVNTAAQAQAYGNNYVSAFRDAVANVDKVLVNNILVGVGGGYIGDTAEFLNLAFDSIVKGFETGDWNDLGSNIAAFGVSLVVSAALISSTIALASAVPVVGPVLGALVAAGWFAYGVYDGWSNILELLEKINDEFFRFDLPWMDPDLPFFNPFPLISPLVIDLDGDGIELTALEGSRTFFDLDEDGFAERTGWVASDDALLALDRNGDGVINDISELFGNATTSGFVELAEFDENGDGVIDASDEVFSDLVLWQDFDGNGYSSVGELTPLELVGLESLSLAVTNVDFQNQGHDVREISSVTWIDGTTSDFWDVWFANSQIHTTPLLDENTVISNTALTLPSLMGYGEVAPTVIAHSENAALEQMAVDLVGTAASGDFDWFVADFDTYLAEWAGVSDVVWLDEAGLVSTIFVYDRDDFNLIENGDVGLEFITGDGIQHTYIPTGNKITPAGYIFISEAQIEDGREVPFNSYIDPISETMEDINYYFPGFYEWLEAGSLGLKAGKYYDNTESYVSFSNGTDDLPKTDAEKDLERNPLGVLLDDGELAGTCTPEPGEICPSYSVSATRGLGQVGNRVTAVSFGPQEVGPVPAPPMGGGMPAQHFAFLQQIFGQNYREADNFIASPNLLVQDLEIDEAAGLEDHYQLIKNSMAAKFLVQGATSHEAIYPGAGVGALAAFDTFEYNPLSDEISGNDYQFSLDVVGTLRGFGKTDLEIIEVLDIFDEEIEITGAFAASYTDFDRSLVHTLTGRTVLEGGTGSDELSSEGGQTLMFGHEGADTITGGGASEVLVGGVGDDVLIGNDGRDFYYYRSGDGSDLISDKGQNFVANGVDTLYFADVARSDVTFGRTGDDMTITLSDGQIVTIESQFDNHDDRRRWGLERIEFADGGFISGTYDIRAEYALDARASGLVIGTQLSNLYTHHLGVGSYTISDKDDDWNAADPDTLIFSDVNRADVTFGRTGDDMTITLSDG